MFRRSLCNLATAFRTVTNQTVQRSISVSAVRKSGGGQRLSDEEFDAKFEAFFNREDIDGWQIRQAMTELHHHDLVPEPKIINAALKACRRVDDYALAVRYLETLRLKCANRLNTIWPYIKQECGPTASELGISFPEDMGYDKPELACKSYDSIF